jgi:hypothetical protein
MWITGRLWGRHSPRASGFSFPALCNAISSGASLQVDGILSLYIYDYREVSERKLTVSFSFHEHSNLQANMLLKSCIIFIKYSKISSVHELTCIHWWVRYPGHLFKFINCCPHLLFGGIFYKYLLQWKLLSKCSSIMNLMISDNQTNLLTINVFDIRFNIINITLKVRKQKQGSIIQPSLLFMRLSK